MKFKKEIPGTVHMMADELRQLATAKLKNLEVPDSDASLIAGSLVQTNLYGTDSHGIALLPHYLRRLQAGSIEPKPQMKFTATGPCTGTLDGGHDFGIVVCTRSMQEAIR